MAGQPAFRRWLVAGVHSGLPGIGNQNMTAEQSVSLRASGCCQENRFSLPLLRCGILIAILLIAKTTVAGMSFNASMMRVVRSSSMAWRRGCEPRVEGVPFYPTQPLDSCISSVM
jgi:hypothetical protein